MEIFSEEKEVTLEEGSLSFLQKFVEEIPELVLEDRDANKERLEQDKQKDLIENEQKHEDRNASLPLDEYEDPTELMAKVNRVFRSIEVCGQILRNRLGSMERKSLELIYEESLSVSLRFLNLFLKYSEFVKEESIRIIETSKSQENSISPTKLTRKVESFYLGMNYMVILGMLYKISFALGSPKGRDIYAKVTENNPNPALCLIQEIIELHFEKKLDFNKIKELHFKFNKNPICDRFLKHIILRHCYMH
jgi:hypothetical protein